MGEELINLKESGYDQKAFLQIRLHELLTRIDINNSNPTKINYLQGCYNYQVVFQDLCSVFQTISSKLKPSEKQKGLEKRNEILQKINKPIKENQLSGKVLRNQGLIQDLLNELFSFRLLIEEFMDAHGFNPSKDDLSKSIIKM